jgi:hypothetical protein
MEKWVLEVVETFRELEAKNPVMLLAKARVRGQLEGALRLLYLQGTRKFGKPDDATVAAIETIKYNLFGLEEACLRIVDPDVRTWEDLLRGLVNPRRRSKAAPR